MPTYRITGTETYNTPFGRELLAGDSLYLYAGAQLISSAPNMDNIGVIVRSNNAGALLYNAGYIAGGATGAVLTDTGQLGRIANIGSIYGGIEGVWVGTGSGGHVANRGTIFGSIAGVNSNAALAVFIENSGQIIGDTAVYQNPASTPTSMTVANTGALVSTNSYAVVLRGSDFVKMDNSGLVDGNVEMRSNGNVTLSNAGTIRGEVFLLDIAGGALGRSIYRASGDGQVLGGVFGDVGNDDFSGALARDYFSGGGGSDTLSGYGGNDSLYGGDAADRLKGGADDDLLQGGAGADRLSGGLGEDVFYFGAAAESSRAFGTDTITDFNRAEDVIDLSVLAGTGRFIGTRKFKADGNFQVREVWSKQTKVGTLLVDTNGDRVADMTITLLGQTGLLSNNNLLL